MYYILYLTIMLTHKVHTATIEYLISRIILTHKVYATINTLLIALWAAVCSNNIYTHTAFCRVLILCVLLIHKMHNFNTLWIAVCLKT